MGHHREDALGIVERTQGVDTHIKAVFPETFSYITGKTRTKKDVAVTHLNRSL